MKKILAITLPLILLCLYTSAGLSRPHEDLAAAPSPPNRKWGEIPSCLGMKGKVKKVTEETYIMKWEDGSLIRELKETAVFEFAKDGRLIRKTTSYDDYENTITYSRFKDGRAMRFDQVIRTPAYTDKDSSRIEVIDYHNDRLITWRNYNSEYASIDTTLACYLGDITEITPLANNGRLSITEVRDSRGNLIRETRSLHGRHASWCEWTFDENDLLINKTGTRPGTFGIMDDYSLFYYYDDFDKRGNWRLKAVKVKEDEYDENSEFITTHIIIRRIKYY